MLCPPWLWEALELPSHVASIQETFLPPPRSILPKYQYISGNNPGLLKYVEIASQAGYDGIEIWVRDLKAALKEGHSVESIKQHILKHEIKVGSAIGFAPWMAEGEQGMIQMQEEMQMLAGIGCERIAAPPAGLPPDKPLDLFAVGEKYRRLLDLGRGSPSGS